MLRLNVDALVTVYKETIAVARDMMKGGKANIHLGYFGTAIYADLLHGGAYACPIDERPFYKGSIQSGKFLPGGTDYDPQQIENLPSAGIGDWIASVFGGSGSSPARLYDEVLINANCPHIFPKLLSDETFGQMKLGLAYAIGTDAFKNGASGIQTLVEAETEFVRGNVTEPLQAASQVASRLGPLLSLLAAGA